MKYEHAPKFEYIQETMDLELEDIEKEYKEWVDAGKPTEIKDDSACSLVGDEINFLKFIESPAFQEANEKLPGMNGMPDLEGLDDEEIMKLL